MLGQQRAEIDVQELVPVQGEAGAVLAPPRRREAKAAAATERLRLADRLDLGADTGERVHEPPLPAPHGTRR